MTVKIFLAACLFLLSFFVTKPNRKLLAEENKQFIYILKYTPEFKQAIKWTAKELQIAKEHVLYVKALIDEGKGYVLGRTPNMYDPELFGIVIFDAPGIEKAEEIMQNDPLITNYIMYGTLSPFNVVLLNGNKAKQLF
jgi:hypothetical protein